MPSIKISDAARTEVAVRLDGRLMTHSTHSVRPFFRFSTPEAMSMMGHDHDMMLSSSRTSTRRNQLLSFGIALATFLAIVQPAASFATPSTFPRHISISSHAPSHLSDDRYVHSYQHLVLSSTTNPNADQHMECAALLPTQAVQVRLGEMSQARKAWKKRRRSGSPLLIPVEVLGLDRTSLVRNNVLAILLKYGNPITNKSAGRLSADVNLPRNGVCLSVSKLCKLMERDYATNLRDNSHVLGFDGVGDMLISLFGGDDDGSAHDSSTSKSNAYGVKVVKGQDNLLLVSKLTKRQAREEVSKVCLAHVASISASDDTTNGASFACHLGTAKVRQDRGPPPTFTRVPLAAAVRVKQEDVEEGRVQSNDLANAFVFSFEQPQSTEDNEGSSPLLTLALHPPPRRVANSKRNQRRQETQINAEENISRELKSLKVGEGPLMGTVVAVSPRAGAAFVDVGVGRERSKRLGGGTTRVLGMLRFEDFPPSSTTSGVTVGDEQEEESMTIEDLAIEDFEAEWDEASKMPDEDEVEYDDEASDEDDDFAGLSPEERLREIGMMLDEEQASSGPALSGRRNLRPGESIEVYVKAISRQSGRFMVTGDPSIKGKKAKDVKMEKNAQKRMDKLAKSLGWEDGLTDLLSSVGLELTAVVKATSKSNAGACYYVQPVDSDLPVGIANCDEQEGAKSLSPGDEVQIRLEGVDETRGQISFTVL